MQPIARDLFRISHDREPALRRYEYWRGSEPRQYYTLIACDDFHGFLAHQTSAHHESAAPVLGELIESLRIEWIDPVAGASDLPSTRMQDLAADADELTRRYSERFAAQIATWWLALR